MMTHKSYHKYQFMMNNENLQTMIDTAKIIHMTLGFGWLYKQEKSFI